MKNALIRLTKKVEHSLFPLLLTSVLLLGFLFRINTLNTSTSFWSDEALQASSAQRIIQDFSIASVSELSRYQPSHALITSLSFYFFGTSESVARLSPAIFSSLSLILIALIGYKIGGRGAALLATSMQATSFLVLGQELQAKPYAALNFFFLLSILVITHTKLTQVKKIVVLLVLSLTAMSFHVLGVLYLLFVLPLLVQMIRRKNRKILVLSILSFLLVSLVAVLMLLPSMISIFSQVVSGFTIHNVYLAQLLFLRHYGWLSIPALFGAYLLLKEKKNLIGVTIWAVTLIFLWTFVQYSHNIRYLVNLFSLLFLCSAVFWNRVILEFFPKRMNFFVVCALCFAFVWGSGKFALSIQPYFSPNTDFHGDVQNADYKKMYHWLKQEFPQYHELYLVNNTFDTERWYLGRNADVYFSKSALALGSHMHPEVGKPVLASVEDFRGIQESQQAGVVIVEEWESFLPEDVKSYVKDNLTLLYSVECLEQSPSDCWSLSIYSWGDLTEYKKGDAL